MESNIVEIEVNENLILTYDNGRLCTVEKPLSFVTIQIYNDGDIYYYDENAKLHRDNDPAIIRLNGECEWWNRGRFVRRNYNNYGLAA